MSATNFDFVDSDSDRKSELRDLQQRIAFHEFAGPSTSATTSQFTFPTGSENSSFKEPNEEAKIDRAISLNKQYDEKLQRLETILNARLYECDQKLSAILSNKNNKSVDKQGSFRYVNCGKPYFRDKANFTPPNNEDTKTMINFKMYDFSSLSSVPGWTVKDKSQFLDLLLEMSKEIKRKDIEKKILALKREAKNNPSESIEQKIALLSKEMENVKNKLLKDLALPINVEYDWEEVASKLKRRHSAHEYQALWKLYLHPSINKRKWTKSEHTALQRIASQNNNQNWDDIAKKLGTKRTDYQCFVYFRTNMSNTFTGKKWTKEEEEYLKRLIDYYREGKYIPWGKVATSMENRTKIQIYNKYFRLVEQRKGRFLAEEDAVILTCAEQLGTDFRKMTTYIPGRSSTQLRLRYQILAKKRISTVWTIEEDKKLLKLLANEDSPSVFSSLTKHFPGKDRMHIRSRYLTLTKWMSAHPNVDLSRAPRRAARRLGHGKPLDNLNKAIDNLKQKIQSEVEERKCKKVTIKSSESDIDDAIMATLLNQIIQEEEDKKLQQSEKEKIILKDDTTVSTKSLNVTNLRKLLTLFKANLNKEQLSQSKYCQMYPDLLKSEKEVSLVKCYSRKNSLKTVVNPVSDTFGKNTVEDTEYVLPPHYATITGCRQLMTWISDKKDSKSNECNVNELLRKSSLFKQHFNTLMERFNTLFLWPMLLSNESPQCVVTEVDEMEYDNGGRPLPKTNDPPLGIGIAIPEMESNLINDTIDLEESEINKEEINLPEIAIDKVNNLG